MKYLCNKRVIYNEVLNVIILLISCLLGHLMDLEVHLVHLVVVLCTVGDLVVVRLSLLVVLLDRLVVVLCIKDGQVVDLLLVGRLGLLVRQVLPVLVVLILVVLLVLVVALLSQVVVLYLKVDQLC